MNLPKYDSYKDSGVEWLGAIPENWEILRNFSVFQERKEVNKPDMELLSVTIEKGIIKQSEITTKKDSSNEDKSKYKVVYQGDLAYNKMRMWQGAIGFSEYDGIVSPAYIILNINKKDKFYPKYFHYLYRTPLFIKEANRHSYGLCDDMNSLRYEHFKTIYSPVPSIAEQKRIAEFLDRKCGEIDEAIAKKQCLIELLEEQKTILINQAVTKGLDPNAPMKDSGIEWLGEIPEHWKVSRLGFLGKIGNGSTPDRSNLSFWKDGSIPWLNSSKVNEGIVNYADQFVTQEAVNKCHLPIVRENSLILAITGEGKTRGTVAISKIKTTINQHLAYIYLTSNKIYLEFLFLYLQAMYQNMRNDSSGSGSTKGAITCQSIKKYYCPIPSIEEQKNIVFAIEKETNKIKNLQKKTSSQIEKLTELKQILIAEAVTGKIKV